VYVVELVLLKNVLMLRVKCTNKDQVNPQINFFVNRQSTAHCTYWCKNYWNRWL